MKLFTLFETEGEYIPYDRSKSTANQVGSQLARMALTKTGGNRAKAKDLADKLAKRFLSDVTATIDDELGMRQNTGFDGWA